MGNIFNDDFRDFIRCFNEFGVRYILVGGYSVILNGYSRTTGDMDIWVERTAENYNKIERAFLHFGMSVFDMTEDVFLNHPDWDVFTFGIPPSAIDIMTVVKGLTFDDCYKTSTHFEEGGLTIRTIHISDLITRKKPLAGQKTLMTWKI